MKPPPFGNDQWAALNRVKREIWDGLKPTNSPVLQEGLTLQATEKLLAWKGSGLGKAWRKGWSCLVVVSL